MKRIIALVFALSAAGYCSAQEKDLGDKEYLIVKDYKPVLAESIKISDQPEGDTSSAEIGKLEYSLAPKKLETNFEAGVIKAIKIKDEPLAKLYHSLLKLGIGNYSTYYGEMFYNTLRSRKAQAGLHINHLSGRPTINDNNGAFSHNTAEVYGRYFLDHSTFNGRLGLDRDVVHYYGYDRSDTTLSDAKQRFNDINLSVGYESAYLTNDHLDHHVNFDFHNFADLYSVSENDFLLSGGGGKKINENYFGAELSFNYFKKSLADNELLTQYSQLSRNIFSINPYLKRNFDKILLNIGFNFTYEKNVGEFSKAHLYPDVRVTVPIAEHVVYIYGNVTGGIEKTTYRTLANENPFINPIIQPAVNQSNDLVAHGGLRGNFSSSISFDAALKYTKFSEMPLFMNVFYPSNLFSVVTDDGNVLDIHGEVAYHKNDKLRLGIAFDQYSYNMKLEQKAWHKPLNETKLFAQYNLQDKILANAILYFKGNQDVPVFENNYIVAQTIKGYADINLGLEYRYSKILSFYINLNNLGFKAYQRWYGYPSEKFNVLGGLTYAL